MRRNRSLSLAKYQPNSTSMARPIKKVSTGVMEFSIIDLRFSTCSSALRVQSGLRLFQDVGNRRFVDLDFYVVSHFHEDSGLFHIRNETVNAGVGHDAVTGFQACNQILL